MYAFFFSDWRRGRTGCPDEEGERSVDAGWGLGGCRSTRSPLRMGWGGDSNRSRRFYGLRKQDSGNPANWGGDERGCKARPPPSSLDGLCAVAALLDDICSVLDDICSAPPTHSPPAAVRTLLRYLSICRRAGAQRTTLHIAPAPARGSCRSGSPASNRRASPRSRVRSRARSAGTASDSLRLCNTQRSGRGHSTCSLGVHLLTRSAYISSPALQPASQPGRRAAMCVHTHYRPSPAPALALALPRRQPASAAAAAPQLGGLRPHHSLAHLTSPHTTHIDTPRRVLHADVSCIGMGMHGPLDPRHAHAVCPLRVAALRRDAHGAVWTISGGGGGGGLWGCGGGVPPGPGGSN